MRLPFCCRGGMFRSHERHDQVLRGLKLQAEGCGSRGRHQGEVRRRSRPATRRRRRVRGHRQRKGRLLEAPRRALPRARRDPEVPVFRGVVPPRYRFVFPRYSGGDIGPSIRLSSHRYPAIAASFPPPLPVPSPRRSIAAAWSAGIALVSAQWRSHVSVVDRPHSVAMNGAGQVSR